MRDPQIAIGVASNAAKSNVGREIYENLPCKQQTASGVIGVPENQLVLACP